MERRRSPDQVIHIFQILILQREERKKSSHRWPTHSISQTDLRCVVREREREREIYNVRNRFVWKRKRKLERERGEMDLGIARRNGKEKEPLRLKEKGNKIYLFLHLRWSQNGQHTPRS